jgi:phosphohistidine phosphatase
VIWLLRHGDAESGDDDDARRLTSEGQDQAHNAGRALAALEAPIAACLASPKVRAIDTARLACQYLGVEPREAAELAGGRFDPRDVEMSHRHEQDGDVLMVGHEPDMSEAIARLTGGSVKLKKGGLAALDDGVLHVLLRPPELRAIAGSS